MNVSPYRIVLMETHTMLRRALNGLIGEHADLAVFGEMGNGDELFKFLECNKLVPDMIILDLFAPSLRGVKDMHRLKLSHPEVKVLVLSVHENQEYLHHALSNGAAGYIIKKEANTEMFPAINKIRDGGIYIPPSLCEKLL